MEEVKDTTIEITKPNVIVQINVDILQNHDNKLSDLQVEDIAEYIVKSISSTFVKNVSISVE